MMVYPLAIYRGDSHGWQFRLWQDAARTIPVDLTGVSAAAEIRTASGAQPITALACSVAANVISVVLSAADSRALPPTAQWDLQLTYSSADVKTIVAGGVTVSGDITDSSPGGGRRG